MCHFWAQNGPFVLKMIFLVQSIIATFIYLLTLFIVQNFQKFLKRIQSYVDAPFLGPKWSICTPKIFLENYEYHSHISPFHCVKFKKNCSGGSRNMVCNFWAQNGPFLQMRIFSENLFMSLASFIHAYLHARNQIQISSY